MSPERLVTLTRAYRNTTEFDGKLPGQNIRQYLSDALSNGADGDVRLYRPIEELEKPDVRVYFLSTDAYKLATEFLKESRWAIAERDDIELSKLRPVDLR